MSDLTATNCGCNNSCDCRNNNMFGGSCIWIILLLVFCGGCGNGNGILGGNCGNNCDNDNGCCDILILIILLSCFCGNGNGILGGCGNNCC